VKSNDASLRFDALTYRGMTYTVESILPDPDLDVLSRASDGTPSVVFSGAIDEGAFESASQGVPSIELRELEDAERLIELPDELDGRVRALAAQSTRGLETDFEKAIALESFFRTPGNFVYSTAIVPGHGADDLAAWLLDPESDNYRTGYCEQFSTAMAVMARTLGIPSRVVLGFTPGTLLDDGRVVVRDRNAHSWVELWMPSQGWVRFDPTPRSDGVNPTTVGQIPFDVAPYLDIPEAPAPQIATETDGPVLFRDEEALDIPERITVSGGDDSVATPTLPPWALPTVGALLIAFGLVPAVKWVRRRLRLRRLESGDIAAAWREIVDRLTDLGDGPDPAATPAEFARSTDPVMQPLADAYGAAIYGPAGASDSSVGVAVRSLEETEDRLLSRYPVSRRLTAHYRIGTLLPRWLRRRRR
jgi:hypothetical protein